MPAKRKRGDLEGALGALVSALSEAGAPFMIIGGIAVIARGVRRFTTDIDAAVRGDAITVVRLARVLARHGIEPRIEDAVAFARKNLVLLLRHAASGADLDVSLAWSSFEHHALDAADEAAFGAVRTKMATPSDLVVFKAIAGRPRDLDDIEALLTLYPRIKLRAVRARVVELTELAGAPELMERFDQVVARVRRERRLRAKK